MHTKNPYNAYKSNSINLASQNQLLLMLLDGAVKYTKIAILAIKDGNLDLANKEIIRVQDIFTELIVTLDKDANEGTKQIYEVYEYIKFELIRANIRKNISVIENVLPVIEDVRNMWYEADKLSKRGR